MKWYRALPSPARTLLKRTYAAVYQCLPVPWWIHTEDEKYESELAFWRSRYAIDQGTFKNAHYQSLVLAIAGEADTTFIAGKVVADFGCGPRGSLVWADKAAIRIGIDVLANRYFEEFKDSLASHGMIYVESSETVIPLPTGFVDVLVTLNALDHVANLPGICRELIRILKPRGELIGSFNIGEPPTPTEPQRLTEESLRELLLRQFDVASYRIARQGPEGDAYRYLLAGDLRYQPGEPGYLWVRARKRG